MHIFIIKFMFFSSLLFACQTYALECPKIPVQVKKDAEIKIRTEVGKIGPVRGAELEATVKTVTQDLLSKLPGPDKVYLEQMMFAAYCTSIRDAKSIPDDQKSQQILEYRKMLEKSLKPDPSYQEPQKTQPKTHSFNAPVLTVAYSPSRIMGLREFWVGQSEDGQVVAVDAQTNKILRKIKCDDVMTQGVSILRNTSHYIAIKCGTKIMVHSLNNESDDFILNPLPPYLSATYSSAEYTLSSALNAFATSGIGRCAHLWDVEHKSLLAKLQCDTEVGPIALDDFGGRLLTSTSSGIISLWSNLFGTPELRWTTKLKSDLNPSGEGNGIGIHTIKKVAIGKSGKLALAVTLSPNVFLINIATGSTTFVSHYAKSKVHDATFDKSGQFLATAASDGRVIVWNTTDSSKVWTFEHDEEVNRVAFSEDGRFLISCSTDKSTRVWSIESGKETDRVDHDKRTATLDIQRRSNGEYVLVGTGQRFRKETGIFYIKEWRLTASGKLAAEAGTI